MLSVAQIYSKNEGVAYACTINEYFVTQSLLYTNYESRCAEVFSKTYPWTNKQYNKAITEYIIEFSRQNNWQIFKNKKLLSPFVSPRLGVSEGLLVSRQSAKNFHQLESSFPLDIPIFKGDKKFYGNKLKRVLQHLNNRAVIIVELNMTEVVIHTFKKFYRSEETFWNYKHYLLDLQDISLRRQYYISNDNISLLSKSIPDDWRINAVLNLLNHCPSKISDEKYLDLLRATYTNMLLKVFYEFNINGYGFTTPKERHLPNDYPLVILTGDIPAMINNLGINTLMLLDGLQMSGMFYLHVDQQNQFMNLVSMSNDNFVVPLYTLFADQIDLMIAQSKDFYLGDKMFLQVQKNKLSKTKYEVLLMKNAVNRFISKKNTFWHFSDSKLPDLNLKNLGKTMYIKDVRSVIMDLRKTPVSYGPAINHNRLQVPEWVSGFNHIKEI